MDFGKQFGELKSAMDDMRKSAIMTAKTISPEVENGVREMLAQIDKGISLENPDMLKNAMAKAAEILNKNEGTKG